jgi:hypothetical protein
MQAVELVRTVANCQRWRSAPVCAGRRSRDSLRLVKLPCFGPSKWFFVDGRHACAGARRGESLRSSPSTHARRARRTCMLLLLAAAGRAHADCAPPLDTDGDGICDPVDNCVSVPNPDQLDTYGLSSGDGSGDACEPKAEARINTVKIRGGSISASPKGKITIKGYFILLATETFNPPQIAARVVDGIQLDQSTPVPGGAPAGVRSRRPERTSSASRPRRRPPCRPARRSSCRTRRRGRRVWGSLRRRPAAGRRDDAAASHHRDRLPDDGPELHRHGEGRQLRREGSDQHGVGPSGRAFAAASADRYSVGAVRPPPLPFTVSLDFLPRRYGSPTTIRQVARS